MARNDKLQWLYYNLPAHKIMSFEAYIITCAKMSDKDVTDLYRKLRYGKNVRGNRG